MYVTVPYNKVVFSVLYFFTSQSEVDFGMALVCVCVYIYIFLWNPSISVQVSLIVSSEEHAVFALTTLTNSLFDIYRSMHC